MVSAITPMKWFAILAILGVMLALGLPPDPHDLQQLHISETTYRVAILVLLVPYIVIWYAGFYTYTKLQEYKGLVRQSREGVAFTYVAKGMGILAFGLVLPTICTLVLNYQAQRHPDFQPAATIISNYITILFPLIAFCFINRGSNMLVRITKGRPSLIRTWIFAVVFTLLGVSFAHLVIRNQHLHQSYHLPIAALILTFIVPYLFTWFLALVAAGEFRLHAIHVKGLLYRQALRRLAAGIAIAIIGSTIMQFVNSTFGARATSLGTILIIDYVLLLTILIGFIYMSLGATRLKQFEEV